MHKIVVIQNIVKQNQKYILKIIKKVCKEQAWKSYKKLSEEEKDKTKKCRRMLCRNASDEDKQK